MQFKALLSKIKEKLFKHKRILISSTCATVLTSSIIPLINAHDKVALDDVSLREIIEALEIDDLASKLPIPPKDAVLVNKILEFENTHGCKIHFVHNDKQGSNYRVDDSFWADYSKSNPDIYERFVEIVGDDEIIRECKSRESNDKLWIRSKSKKWIFSLKDQSNNSLREWSNK
ncbi:hypothetical protein MHF_0604 [Mycoplasma haemofelis Ohio2]|uniref:Uncharacterized protein n=1 Tax=Mycoplasma haemofelis (strain Ohio2) TaxID=859194 RepID=F6FI28_MYCHI|nr:hypothetical protein MHF_0604 [Mycoplasma haemofelis Ohio2]